MTHFVPTQKVCMRETQAHQRFIVANRSHALVELVFKVFPYSYEEARNAAYSELAMSLRRTIFIHFSERFPYGVVAGKGRK